MQFHENAAVIAWWLKYTGSALSWFTPFRRRAILAGGALWVAIREPVKGITAMEVPDSDNPELLLPGTRIL